MKINREDKLIWLSKSIFDIDVKDCLHLIATLSFASLDLDRIALLIEEAFVNVKRGGGTNLERLWYTSLKLGKPDFSVYANDAYIGEVWVSWIIYSRKYLRMLNKLIKDMHNDLFTDIHSIADLGCGFGFTCAGFKELWPIIDVLGTNIAGTMQFNIAAKLGEVKKFIVIPELNKSVDLVFASEYFEHFEYPIEHLEKILDIGNPKLLILANSFGGQSTGHFNYYMIGRQKISNKGIGREFNTYLRNYGYMLIETGFWNNRPMIWRKKNSDKYFNFGF